MKFFTGLLALQILIEANQTDALVKTPKIICFTAFWTRYSPVPMNYVASSTRAEPCDTLIYAFATVNKTTWEITHRDHFVDMGLGGFRQTVAIKEQNPKLKVILSVGGMPYKGMGEVIHYSNMMAESSRRQIFVESTVKFLRTHKFDGLELHWYYPGSSKGMPNDKDNFLLLVQELRVAFSQDNFTLCATVPFLESDIVAGYHVAELNKYLDYFHVRTIGMNVYDKFLTDNASPLRKRSFDVEGAAEENVESVLNIYVSFGASKEKLIFGIPFEHHVFRLQDPKNDYLKAPAFGLTTEQGLFSKTPGVLFYHEVCAKIQSGKWIPKWDEDSGVPYAVDHQTSQWVSYEDDRTLTSKVNFLKKGGFGGVFVWLMDNDDFRGLCGEKNSLLNTIKRLIIEPP